MAHLIEHLGKKPQVDPSAYVAPTAVLCGDVTVGPQTRILFGAVLTAEGGPVEVGAECIIMENAVLRGSSRNTCRLGDQVLVGPRSYLTGCEVESRVFLATGVTVFNGARVETGCQVRINGLVHLRTVLKAGSIVPIGWVAVGDPAQILPPDQHEAIWDIQQPLDLPKYVFGLERAPIQELMPKIVARWGKALDEHLLDKPVTPGRE